MLGSAEGQKLWRKFVINPIFTKYILTHVKTNVNKQIRQKIICLQGKFHSFFIDFLLLIVYDKIANYRMLVFEDRHYFNNERGT